MCAKHNSSVIMQDDTIYPIVRKPEKVYSAEHCFTWPCSQALRQGYPLLYSNG